MLPNWWIIRHFPLHFFSVHLDYIDSQQQRRMSWQHCLWVWLNLGINKLKSVYYIFVTATAIVVNLQQNNMPILCLPKRASYSIWCHFPQDPTNSDLDSDIEDTTNIVFFLRIRQNWGCHRRQEERRTNKRANERSDGRAAKRLWRFVTGVKAAARDLGPSTLLSFKSWYI